MKNIIKLFSILLLTSPSHAGLFEKSCTKQLYADRVNARSYTYQDRQREREYTLKLFNKMTEIIEANQPLEKQDIILEKKKLEIETREFKLEKKKQDVTSCLDKCTYNDQACLGKCLKN